MTTAKLIILRHGQTEYNKQHLMTGQRDVPLTVLGEEQAREAGELIRGVHFNKVYSSTLSRAFNTAALALQASGTQSHLLNADGTWQIEQRREVIELDEGTFTGRNHRTDPEIMSWHREYDKPYPQGESEKQLVERLQKFFDDEVMPRLQRGENVLIVAHSGVVRAFDIVTGVEQAPVSGVFLPRKKHIMNATPIVYNYEDGVLADFSALDNPKAAAANQNALTAKPKKRGPEL